MRPVVAVIVALVLFAAIVSEAAPQKYVTTPFGQWPAECVHGVEPGAIVRNEGTSRFRIISAEGEEQLKPACNHFVGSGAPKAPSKELDGWQVWTKEAIGNVTQFLGTWNVPPNPDESAQTLFLFTGMQNIDWVPPNPEPTQAFDIIQPVLQYGYSAAGGYDGWSIASWYVTLGNDVVYSTLKKVKTGDVIFGNMSKTGDDSWYISTVDVTSQIVSDFTIQRSILATQPWIYVTLEVYDVDTCAQYPPTGSSCEFTKLSMEQNFQKREVPFKWQMLSQDTSCGQQIATTDAGDEVIITF